MLRLKRHLALVLVLIALFVKFWPAGEQRAENDPNQGLLTVRGLRLGMTRDEVLKKLGPPVREVASDVYRHFKEARYKQSQGFGEPEVTYNAQGRIVSVSGESLEWPGGSFAQSTDLKQIKRFFTDFPPCQDGVCPVLDLLRSS